MAFFSAELAVGELTLLLFPIVFALIPLTIWLLCNEDETPTTWWLDPTWTEISQCEV